MKVRFIFLLILSSIPLCYGQNGLDTSDAMLLVEKSQLAYDDNDGYPVFKSIENSIIENGINARIESVISHQTKTDSFKVKLKNHLAQSLYVNFSVLNKESEADDFFQEKNYLPVLRDTEYKLSFYDRSILTLIVLFHYDAEIPDYPRNRTFSNTYYESYYFDVATGKEYLSSDVFNIELKTELNKLLIKKLEEKIQFLPSSDQDYESVGFLFPNRFEEFEDPENISKPYHRELSDFSVLDFGIVFPKSFSLEFFIPRWSFASSGIALRDLSIRLTRSEIRRYLNPHGPFQKLIADQDKAGNTTIKGNNNPPSHFTFNLVNQHHDVFIDYRDTTRSVRKTTIYRQRQYGEELREKSLYQEITRLQNGLIDTIKKFGEDGSSTTYLFEYDHHKNLRRISNEDEYGEYVWEFDFDDNNNLVYYSRNGDEPTQEYYEYYSNYYSTESFPLHDPLNNYRTVKLFDSNNKSIKEYRGNLGLNEVSFTYDEHNNLTKELGTYPFSNEPWFENEYSYNHENKLTLKTYDRNRKTSYEYDSKGRLVKRIIDGSGVHIIWVRYNDDNRPSKISTNKRSRGYSLLYSITYDLW